MLAVTHVFQTGDGIVRLDLTVVCERMKAHPRQRLPAPGLYCNFFVVLFLYRRRDRDPFPARNPPAEMRPPPRVHSECGAMPLTECDRQGDPRPAGRGGLLAGFILKEESVPWRRMTHFRSVGIQ